MYEAYTARIFDKKYLLKNIISGVVVGLTALPLSMAFAIASGVKPEQGIYTAIIAGIIVGLFGGSRVQIAGPTGAFVVILASIAAQHGVVGLQMATIMAGLLLVIMSIFKLGQVIKFIPYPVVVGFTSGIGVIIFFSSWKDFFGLPTNFALDAPFAVKLFHLLENIGSLDPTTSFIALSSLAILIILPYFFHFIPAAIIAMLYGTVMQFCFNFPTVATIGSVFGHIPQNIPALIFPEVSLNTFNQLISSALLIAFLGAIESLLSATAADSMCNTKHDSNRELFGQGLANIVSPLFGGIAATGAIARTVINIRNGGSSPVAAVVHAITLILVIAMLAPYAEYIPFASLAAILFVVAFNMSDVPEFIHLIRNAPRHDVAVLLITFMLTIFSNLITGVVVGVILAILLFMSRMHELTTVTGERIIESGKEFPKDTIVFNIDGPFYFGVAEKIEHALADLHMDVKNVIFRLNKVSMIDMTGLEIFSKIIEQYHKRHVKIFLCEANQRISAKLHKMHITDWIESKNIYKSINDIQISM